jgi:hypothetical protein
MLPVGNGVQGLNDFPCRPAVELHGAAGAMQPRRPRKTNNCRCSANTLARGGMPMDFLLSHFTLLGVDLQWWMPIIGRTIAGVRSLDADCRSSEGQGDHRSSAMNASRPPASRTNRGLPYFRVSRIRDHDHTGAPTGCTRVAGCFRLQFFLAGIGAFLVVKNLRPLDPSLRKCDRDRPR